MDKNKRKEMLSEYKQIKTHMGVIKITNLVNGKVFITAYPNLKNKWMNIQSALTAGIYSNAQLIKDWQGMGQEAFSYEVLEEKETEGVNDVRWELKQMERAWLEKIQPYGDRGYNKPPGK
jgi:bifunctional N-acetylglucosamine-1-phosphate-uridyltransferase/glucosamine-1-phosphate-acetyltransferase GlmU-like protein